ncbi:hypothetical protein LARI1_G008512 [Lachnellula arida]|uniref:Uncharacterized protein n=1 Tax=Lachnellula arida TaxID=1316785 RepID=A0A8T9AYA4_9HELO|nr:hypothetical protein LARI1_G008512 [Lachnellula arida]
MLLISGLILHVHHMRQASREVSECKIRTRAGRKMKRWPTRGKGIVMPTGYNHRGVVNACRNAVDLPEGTVPLHVVLGGYNLAGSPHGQVEETIKDLKALNPKYIFRVIVLDGG